MLFQLCSVEAGDSGWSRGAIRRRGARSSIVRTGQRSLPQAVEHKHNHNHDPRNGQFTFAAGGLFADVARQGGKTGITARKLNRIVSDPKAAETINPLGHPVTIARTGGNSVELTGPLGAFQATGRFQRVPGRQGLTISIEHYALKGVGVALAKIESFPKTITLFTNLKGQLAFAFDRDLAIRKSNPFSPVPEVTIAAGGYALDH